MEVLEPPENRVLLATYGHPGCCFNQIDCGFPRTRTPVVVESQRVSEPNEAKTGEIWLSVLPKHECISDDLKSRLESIVVTCGIDSVLATLASPNIEDQLTLLFQLYNLPLPPTFDKPSSDELRPFYRWSFLGSTNQRNVCEELLSSSPSVDNIHLLRQVLTAGLYLTHVNCRLESTGQLPSLEAICLVLTECRLLYVKQGAIHVEDMALLLRRFFHHGIFRWPQSTSPSACCQNTALAFAVPPDSEFV
ncbi:unnamed protein product [Aphanomyces euteiches]|uniref:Uncharacterized protein n=1 Tax=Aphanomyces euteiches TaxID=100861 RepID=A0A6G0X2R4_9STRA|nr:hypothetical protein Ae201684_009025 [Aphanomyces euteiches]KAH9073641.1 hypothetical protein Ae201684P_003145 [Aphanomyces euteiches]KAH9134615.1 hypothetical protein AeRB84_019662 [Aphanomyces euteiches]